MSIFRGIDGCHGGWVAVDVAADGAALRVVTARVCERFMDALAGSFLRVAVDIPIGIADRAEFGGREADSAARAILGPRASSVFPTPVRATLKCATYEDAARANMRSSLARRSLTRQAYAITPKIREVDEVMNPDLQRAIVETHPELCFLGLAGKPMSFHKRKPEGFAERESLLGGAGLEIDDNTRTALKKQGAARDDVNDAMACAWTAWRVEAGKATRIPAKPPVDSCGLRMEMWY